MKSDKMLYMQTLNAGTESLIKEIDNCKNNPDKRTNIRQQK